MTSPSGIHHLAVMTKDMKSQIEFFTEVLGMPLVGLYDMHGAPGAWHAFLRLDDTCYLALCQVPGVEAAPATIGVTHAGTGAGVSAAGTMQHVAFKVNDEDGLLAMRDRLRSHGIVVFGPIDHGMCRSIYFAGPENLTLEGAWSAGPIDGAAWIDPSVAAAAGISTDELDRFRTPRPFDRPREAVPQPAADPGKPHLAYPPKVYAAMIALSDDAITQSASVPDPPVKVVT
jgi:catechol 2,3-dioxygenase-like lactoylglutathione lyase family enzyme